MIVIGVDPGKHTGICAMKDGKISLISTVDFWWAIEIIESSAALDKTLVVVELADTMHVWHPTKNKLSATRAGLNVGMCMREAQLIIQYCIINNIDVVQEKPKGKLAHEEFRRATGYQKRVSQHARDAGMLAHNWRNWKGEK